MNHPYHKRPTVILPKFKAKISNWGHNRRAHEICIIHRKVLFKYCAQLEAEISSWLHHRLIHHKSIIPRKIRLTRSAPLIANISSWPTGRRKDSKWIIQTNIWFKNITQFPATLCTSPHNQRKNDQWMIYIKISANFMPTFEYNLQVSHMIDEKSSVNDSKQDSSQIFCSIWSKQFDLITWLTNTSRMNSPYKDSIRIFRLLQKRIFRVYYMIDENNIHE